jgi:hypothetical protein
LTRSAFKGFLGYLQDTFPRPRAEIKQVVAEGDFVIGHVHFVRRRDDGPASIARLCAAGRG